METQVKKGLIEVCVLAALVNESSYGYKIVRDVSTCVDISESTLYPILKRLEAGGNVTASSAEHNGRFRKYYTLTDDGRSKINAFLDEWEEIDAIYRYVRDKTQTNEGGTTI